MEIKDKRIEGDVKLGKKVIHFWYGVFKGGSKFEWDFLCIRSFLCVCSEGSWVVILLKKVLYGLMESQDSFAYVAPEVKTIVFKDLW